MCVCVYQKRVIGKKKYKCEKKSLLLNSVRVVLLFRKEVETKDRKKEIEKNEEEEEIVIVVATALA